MSVQVQPFLSTVPGKLDSKGRICIPSAYRQILAAQNTPGVYAVRSFSSACLECFGEELLQSFYREIAGANPFFTKDYNARAAMMLGTTKLLALDETGRLSLPEEMIAHAGLKDPIVFFGLGTKFQIWEPERFRDALAALEQRALEMFNADGGTP